MTPHDPTLAKDLARAERRLSMTKYILLFAFLLWPLGLFFSELVSFLIFVGLFCLWAVSTYIAYMHCLTLKKRR